MLVLVCVVNKYLCRNALVSGYRQLHSQLLFILQSTFPPTAGASVSHEIIRTDSRRNIYNHMIHHSMQEMYNFYLTSPSYWSMITHVWDSMMKEYKRIDAIYNSVYKIQAYIHSTVSKTTPIATANAAKSQIVFTCSLLNNVLVLSNSNSHRSTDTDTNGAEWINSPDRSAQLTYHKHKSDHIQWIPSDDPAVDDNNSTTTSCTSEEYQHLQNSPSVKSARIRVDALVEYTLPMSTDLSRQVATAIYQKYSTNAALSYRLSNRVVQYTPVYTLVDQYLSVAGLSLFDLYLMYMDMYYDPSVLLEVTGTMSLCEESAIPKSTAELEYYYNMYEIYLMTHSINSGTTAGTTTAGSIPGGTPLKPGVRHPTAVTNTPRMREYKRSSELKKKSKNNNKKYKTYNPYF